MERLFHKRELLCEMNFSIILWKLFEKMGSITNANIILWKLSERNISPYRMS
jgi:hypothetical protein